MSNNALEKLRAAGIVTSTTSQAALDVLGGISEEEANVLSSLNARIQEAMAPEVVAHSEEGDEEAPCVVFICPGYSTDVQ